MHLDRLKFPIVQLSLDLVSLDEAIETASIGVAAGVDWLEAGTPLLLAEGLRAVEALRARFPERPIVADVKTMDGGKGLWRLNHDCQPHGISEGAA